MFFVFLLENASYQPTPVWYVISHHSSYKYNTSHRPLHIIPPTTTHTGSLATLARSRSLSLATRFAARCLPPENIIICLRFLPFLFSVFLVSESQSEEENKNKTTRQQPLKPNPTQLPHKN